MHFLIDEYGNYFKEVEKGIYIPVKTEGEKNGKLL